MTALLRADADKPLDEVDRRIRHALMTAAMASGFKASALMTAVLSSPPAPEGLPGAVRYFGGEDRLREVIQLLTPMMFALNSGMPGFSEWLDRTGYGNDCGMIRALLAWCEADPEMRAVAARMSHANKLH